MTAKPEGESRSPPCIVFALRRESMFFRRTCGALRPVARAPLPAWQSTTGELLLETGVGWEAMERAARWVLGRGHQPSLVVLAGFSGSLSPALSVGDLVLATEVIDLEGGRWPLPGWETDLEGMAGAVHRGRVLTTPALVGDPAQKRQLGERHSACAVDMESAALAQACSAETVPFLCVRAISDSWAQPLAPDLVELLRGGRVSPWRLLRAVLRRPTLLAALLRLARDTKLAARNLSLGLQALLPRSGV